MSVPMVLPSARPRHVASTLLGHTSANVKKDLSLMKVEDAWVSFDIVSKHKKVQKNAYLLQGRKVCKFSEKLSFCSMTKGISPKICILCVRVILKISVFWNVFVFGFCFRTLAVILFQISFSVLYVIKPTCNSSQRSL